MKSQTDKRIDGLKTGDGAYTSGNGISISGDVISAKLGLGLYFDADNKIFIPSFNMFPNSYVDCGTWNGDSRNRVKKFSVSVFAPTDGNNSEVSLTDAINWEFVPVSISGYYKRSRSDEYWDSVLPLNVARQLTGIGVGLKGEKSKIIRIENHGVTDFYMTSRNVYLTVTAIVFVS